VSRLVAILPGADALLTLPSLRSRKNSSDLLDGNVSKFYCWVDDAVS